MPGRNVLVEHSIDVRAKTRFVDGRCVPKCLDQQLARDVTAANRPQLADRYAVSSDDEVLTVIERAQNRAAIVAELSLG